MAYAPFHEKFPDIAQKETRTLTVLDLPGLPPGEYGFVEAYCDEPGCDCRRVFFNVVEWRTQKTKAMIAYGWESRAFYVRWFGKDDPAIIRELQGPVLNSASAQSPVAPALLKQLGMILKDRQYVERLKRHYAMYRAVIDREAGHSAPTPTEAAPPGVHRKLRKRRR
jgi:hypothetical protein